MLDEDAEDDVAVYSSASGSRRNLTFIQDEDEDEEMGWMMGSKNTQNYQRQTKGGLHDFHVASSLTLKIWYTNSSFYSFIRIKYVFKIGLKLHNHLLHLYPATEVRTK